jgi:hypothetical protein
MKSVLCVIGMAVSMLCGEVADAQVFRPQPRPTVVQNVSLKGAIVFLSEEEHTDADPAVVNLGGMLIVNVPDSGSRRPKDIRVDAGQSFRDLGAVAGSQTPEGKVMYGGGYTWYVFQAKRTGQATVRVRYKLNDDDGSIVDREYKVAIEN